MTKKQMTNAMTTIQNCIGELSYDELASLRSIVSNRLSLQQHTKIHAMKNMLRPGMTCKVNHSRLAGKEFIVKKVNRTKAVLTITGTTQSFIVPMSMIEIIK